MFDDVRVEERTLRMTTSGGRERTVTFPAPIAQALNCDAGIAVRCETDPYTLRDRNVFGVTSGAPGVWRVEPQLAGSVCTKLAAGGGHLLATLEDGREVAIDPATGRLL